MDVLATHTPVSAPPSLLSALRERLRGAVDLPVLPTVIIELQAAAAADADARVLADIIRTDALIAAHVLRLVNAPMFRGPEVITSLQQAIARLGIARLRQLALAVSVQTRVFRAPGYEKLVKEVLHHSLAAGMFGLEIARLRRGGADEAFLCGLLHDLGRPAALQIALDLLKNGQRASRDEILAAVDQVHADTGFALAQKWGLPDKVARAARDHHLDLATDVSVAIAQLADTLSHFAHGDVDADAVRGHHALAILELYPDAVEQLLARALVVHDTVGQVAL